MFGRGNIAISIQKTRYAPGDTISGTVDLILKKPLEAREMTLSLVGEYTAKITGRRGLVPGAEKARKWSISEWTTSSEPVQDVKTQKVGVQICPFKEQLGGEGEYSESQRYDLKIKIPSDTPTSSVVKWYLLAKLDIPHGLDITKKRRITIR
jgi:sporulation-control protein spo0M